APLSPRLKQRDTLRLTAGKARLACARLIVAPAHETGAPLHTGIEAVPAPIGIAAHIPDLLLCKVYNGGVSGAGTVYELYPAYVLGRASVGRAAAENKRLV